MTRRKKRQTENEVRTENVGNDTNDPGAGTAGGAIGGAVAGAIAGTVVGGPVGTAVGAAVGAAGGGALGYAADSSTGDGIQANTQENAASTPLMGGPGVVTGAGVGAPTVTPIAGGTGGTTIGAGGIPAGTRSGNRLDEADIERQGGELGPLDTPAAHGDPGDEVAVTSQDLVDDETSYNPARTPEVDHHQDAGTRDYIQDRDDLAQGGEPR